MGCFLGCFGGAKQRRRRKRSPNRSPSRPRAAPEGYRLLQLDAPEKQQLVLKQATPRRSPEKVASDGEIVSPAAPLLASLLELRDSTEEMSLTIIKKKVTFDPNITTYEATAIHEDDEEEDPAEDGEDEKARKENGCKSSAKSEAYPLNYRYNNCDDSDNDSEYEEEEEEDEDEDEDGLDECGIDDDDLLGIGRNEEESCESLFSLPMNKNKESNQEVNSPAPETAPCPDRQTSLSSSGSGTRDRSQFVNSVLNPVENLSQWKEVKARTAAAAPKASNKENIISEQEDVVNFSSEPTFTIKKKERPADSDHSPSTPSKQEVSVDASLSTWLGSSETAGMTRTPESNSVRSYSPISREDRPILGALTVEDIKQSSANSSPRRSPSRSPDDMPILGTVGSYWNCNTNGDDSVTRGGFIRTRSRFGQDKMVNSH